MVSTNFTITFALITRDSRYTTWERR